MGTNTFRLQVAGITKTVSIEVIQTDIDIYIDSQTGHRFEEVIPTTNTYRILNFFDYQDVLEEFPNRINSTEAVKKLKDLSQEVKFEDSLIQTLLQKTQNNSRLTEFQVYIVLKRNWTDPKASPAIITAEEDNHTKMEERKDGSINMDIDGKFGRNKKKYYLSPNNNVVIAQVHGHNKDQRTNYKNIEGTSSTDSNTAKGNGFNIYSLRSYETEVGGQAIIDKVNGKGVSSLNIGATRGRPNNSDKKVTFDVGRDALDFWSKNPKIYTPKK